MRLRFDVYWLSTAVLVGECAIGGTLDLLRAPPFFPVMIGLGYPAYLATIMGIAKLIAAAIMAAPRLRRLKEWAYAGVMINMVGAAASHIAMRQAATALIAPLMFAAVALVSWGSRPPTRKL